MKINISKKPIITYSILFIYFTLVFIIAVFVFKAGIYSCQDVAFLGEGVPAEKIDNFISNCKISQAIGTTIYIIHFLIPLIAGFLVNQLILLAFPNLGEAYGTILMFIGFIPALLLQLYFLGNIISKKLEQKEKL